MNWSGLIAQCVMCYRTAAAQQLERSRVLNSGIAILLVPPVLILAGILLLAFRRSGRPTIRAGEVHESVAAIKARRWHT